MYVMLYAHFKLNCWNDCAKTSMPSLYISFFYYYLALLFRWTVVHRIFSSYLWKPVFLLLENPPYIVASVIQRRQSAMVLFSIGLSCYFFSSQFLNQTSYAIFGVDSVWTMQPKDLNTV